MTAQRSTTIARWIFILAAIYGIPVMASFFFITPKMLNHADRQQPEMYFGFAGVALAWQFVFLLIASDPPRYRPLMLIAAIGEKFLFAGTLAILMIRHIAGLHWIGPACMDGLLGCAFVVAWVLTR